MLSRADNDSERRCCGADNISRAEQATQHETGGCEKRADSRRWSTTLLTTLAAVFCMPCVRIDKRKDVQNEQTRRQHEQPLNAVAQPLRCCDCQRKLQHHSDFETRPPLATRSMSLFAFAEMSREHEQQQQQQPLQQQPLQQQPLQQHYQQWRPLSPPPALPMCFKRNGVQTV